MQVLFNELPRQPSIAIKEPFKWRIQALENARRHHETWRRNGWLAKARRIELLLSKALQMPLMRGELSNDRPGLLSPSRSRDQGGRCIKMCRHNKSLSQIQNAG